MHFEVYTEELSAQCALDNLMPKILGPDHTFMVHTFRGKAQLIAEIPKRLKGYAAWMPDDWRVIVLVDEDREDCLALKRKLDEAAAGAGIQDRILNRIVVEELESWFFGDFEALRAVYPKLKASIPQRERFRDPDQIAGGTWEALDLILRQAGYPGLGKTETATKVSALMDPARNRSKSFQAFRDGVLRLVSDAAR